MRAHHVPPSAPDDLEAYELLPGELSLRDYVTPAEKRCLLAKPWHWLARWLRPAADPTTTTH